MQTIVLWGGGGGGRPSFQNIGGARPPPPPIHTPMPEVDPGVVAQLPRCQVKLSVVVTEHTYCQSQCSCLKVPLSCCADNFYTDPPGPVNNLQVTSHSATSLRIIWAVSGTIDRFEVTYSYTVKKCPAPQGEPRTDTVFDGTMRSHTLRGLNEDSSYTITVRAINIAGTSMVTNVNG